LAVLLTNREDVTEYVHEYGGYMMRADFSEMAWHIEFIGLLFGGILWAVSAGALAGLRAAICSKLI